MFKYIWLGLKDLPGYGPHPGTGTLLFILTIAFWTGFSVSFVIGLKAMLVTLLFLGPLYLYGAYGRGKEYGSLRTKSEEYEIVER